MTVNNERATLFGFFFQFKVAPFFVQFQKRVMFNRNSILMCVCVTLCVCGRERARVNISILIEGVGNVKYL